MYFHHGPQNEEIGRRSNLDILHRANDSTHNHALTVHHRARVYIVVTPLFDSLPVGCKDIIQLE